MIVFQCCFSTSIPPVLFFGGEGGESGEILSNLLNIIYSLLPTFFILDGEQVGNSPLSGEFWPFSWVFCCFFLPIGCLKKPIIKR